MMIQKAIILAGGLGTRLRSAIPDLPKCMAPVGNKPFLSYVIDYFAAQGISEFVFSLGYMHEHIEDFLKEKFREEKLASLRYTISLEYEPLGTGGAVLQAVGYAEAGTVLVLNGDTFFAVDLKSLSSFHQEKKSSCTLCLKPMTNSDRYGVVEINETQRIRSFKEKKWYPESLINGGVYALETNGFRAKGFPQKFSFEKDYLEKYVNVEPIFALVQQTYFIDIGIPEDYYRAQKELFQN